MSEQYSVSSSITIRRIRHGDSLSLLLESNGKPLFQSWDDQAGTCSPDWSVASNQPVITPHVSSLRQLPVTLTNHSWSYNGVTLVFTGTTSGGYVNDTTGKFALNSTTGALKIIGNLANSINTANDTLQYSCVAVVSGTEYNLTQSIDIVIQKGGASSYYGYIDATTLMLDSSHTSSVLTPHLWLSGNDVSSFYVKWYKGSSVFRSLAAAAGITVSRSDVDSCNLFLAEFYLHSDDSTPVCRAGVAITDTLDPIVLVPYISSAAKDLNDENDSVIVKARAYKSSTGDIVTLTTPTWLFEAYDPNTWTVKKTSTTDSITVTTEESDESDGTVHDVRVEVQCQFTAYTTT